MSVTMVSEMDHDETGPPIGVGFGFLSYDGTYQGSGGK